MGEYVCVLVCVCSCIVIRAKVRTCLIQNKVNSSDIGVEVHMCVFVVCCSAASLPLPGLVLSPAS